MRSVAGAFAWQVWTRHRLGLTVSAATLALMVLAYPPILRGNSSTAVFVALLLPPLHVGAYLMNLLIFAEEVGSLTAGYPRRMFALPVPTRTLALWPMLIAASTLVMLWLVVALLAFRPGGYDLPLLLPAVSIALVMTWFQVLCWVPVDGAAARMAVLGSLFLLAIPCLLLIDGWLTPRQLSVLGTCCLPAIYGVGCFTLARARRGERWTLGLDRLAGWLQGIWGRVRPGDRPLRTPRDAQLWYEGRCQMAYAHGMTVLTLSLLFLILCLAPLRDAFVFGFGLAMMLLMPLVLAGSLGMVLGKFHPWWLNRSDLPAWIGCLPVSTAGLLRSKYRLAGRIVVRTWILALVMIAIVVLVRGRSHEVAGWYRQFSGVYPGWRGVVILAAAAVLMPVVHWRLLTDSLVPMLTGRRWIVGMFVILVGALAMGSIGFGVLGGEHAEVVQRALPALVWLLASLVLIRLILAVLTLRADLRLGFVDPGSLRRLLMVWIVLATLALGLTHGLVPYGTVAVPRPVLLLAGLSPLPIARFGMAPLALAWNRHR